MFITCLDLYNVNNTKLESFQGKIVQVRDFSKASNRNPWDKRTKLPPNNISQQLKANGKKKLDSRRNKYISQQLKANGKKKIGQEKKQIYSDMMSPCHNVWHISYMLPNMWTEKDIQITAVRILVTHNFIETFYTNS